MRTLRAARNLGSALRAGQLESPPRPGFPERRWGWTPHVRAIPLILVLALLVFPACTRPRPQSPPADTIFTGQFVTLDASHPRVEAVAVAGGRIMAAGSRPEVELLAGDTTRKIEIPGVALPGLADAHVHVTGLGKQLDTFDLRGLSKDEILKKVADAARSTPADGWILGEGWDEGFWRPPMFPSAAELDAVSAHHPVVLHRIDGHSMWVNSRVLALAGISRRTRDPQGGLILRNTAHEPTGILVDRAMDAVAGVTPGPTHAERERRIRAALQQYARWGLTSIHDAGADLDTIAIYKNLLKAGDLPVRVYVMARGVGPTAVHYLAEGPEIDLGDGRLSIRSFKLLLDGALGSRGAELTDPYTDAPGERGLRLMDDSAVDELVRAARKKGFQINIHAIGDRAIRRVLDAFERGGVTREDRCRVEHASVIAPADLPRFARLGVIASIQPVFVGEYSRWAENRVGSARVRWVLPTRDLLAAGGPVASGTDYPASDSGSPIATLYCLVTRKSAGGEPAGGWLNEQRVDVDAALRSMTAGPAFAAFQEKNLGQLTVGRYADFTAVSADPYKVPPEELRGLAIRMTVVAGRVTFDGGKAGSQSQR
jgi:predicted amidohydrolase YtcJ